MLVITGEKDFRIPYTPGHRRLHRAPAPRHPVAADRLPGRESLGAEAEELDPMVSRGPSAGWDVSETAGNRRHREEPATGNPDWMLATLA